METACEVEKTTGLFTILTNGATYWLEFERDYPLSNPPDYLDRLTVGDLRRLRDRLNEFLRYSPA